MRVKKFPESGPKRRLLDAGEALFAERGFEAVSVRDITGKAEANVAALNYHFGTREDMIDLLIIHYANPIHEERIARLEALEKKSAQLEEACEAWLRPLLTAPRKCRLPEKSCLMLLGRIFSLPPGSFPPEARQLRMDAIQRFIKVLGKALPGTAGDELSWRVYFVEGAMIHLLLGLDSWGESISPPPSAEVLFGRLIRFAAGGLRDVAAAEPPPRKGPQATFDF